MRVSIANLTSLLDSCLSKNEKVILNDLDFNLSVTKFAHKFSKENNIPLSTVWHNLRKLRDKGLIKFSPFSKTKLLEVMKNGTWELVGKTKKD